MVRLEDDLCTISIDTSGAPLHQRGLKQALNKAPMRETLAALFLRQCDYRPGELLVDPMCGSGTFVLEAAERTAGLLPGRVRSFAFEKLASFDKSVWAELKQETTKATSAVTSFGSDRDQGAVRIATANAERAGVADLCAFHTSPVSAAAAPEGPPGLVFANPPYGARIGNKKLLYGLYGAFGEAMRENFKGWRVGLVTSEAGLARATGLSFEQPGPFVDHGGVKIRLYKTGAIK